MPSKKNITVDPEALIAVLVEIYNYHVTEVTTEGILLENRSLPELGDHSILLVVYDESDRPEQLIGQLPDEPNKEDKREKIAQVILNAARKAAGVIH